MMAITDWSVWGEAVAGNDSTRLVAEFPVSLPVKRSALPPLVFISASLTTLQRNRHNERTTKTLKCHQRHCTIHWNVEEIFAYCALHLKAAERALKSILGVSNSIPMCNILPFLTSGVICCRNPGLFVMGTTYQFHIISGRSYHVSKNRNITACCG